MAPKQVIDGRDMMPPEPLELTLGALDDLAEGEELLLLLRGRPYPLYDILRRNGYVHDTRVADDGSVEVRIRKA